MPATITENRCVNCSNHVDFLDLHYVDRGIICHRCFERYIRCDECGKLCERYDIQCINQRNICQQCRTTDCWDVTPLSVSVATYAKIGSTRKYGIELETSRCDSYRTLKNATPYGAKFDCSVTGMEFISPILYGDEGLAETEKFLEYAEENDWKCYNDCGYHLHIDVRDESTIQLRHIAYAYAMTYHAWRGLVSEFRATDNSYCHAPRHTAGQIRNHSGSIVRFFDGTDRYTWLNLSAYDRHKTFEVRIHDGTLHAKTVTYWVMAHTRFVDAVRDMTYNEIDAMFSGTPEENFAALCQVWDRRGQTISGFYRRRFHVYG